MTVNDFLPLADSILYNAFTCNAMNGQDLLNLRHDLLEDDEQINGRLDAENTIDNLNR